MPTKKLPLYLENPNHSLYSDIGERIAAAFLDGLFLTPLTIGMLYFNSLHLNNYYYTFFVSQLLIAAYCIYLPVRYGATPGRRIMGLTILKIDGSAIAYRDAFMKYLPTLVLALFGLVVQGWAVATADDATYSSLPWLKQTEFLKSYYPIPFWLQLVVIYAYYISAIIMVLSNKRHQSTSDAVAGTVVVYTRCLEKIAVFRNEG